MPGQVGLHSDFHAFRHLVGRNRRLFKVEVHQRPSCGFLTAFLTFVPTDWLIDLIGLPERVELLLELLNGDRLPPPPGVVPELQDGVNRGADKQRSRLGLGQPQHVAEVELQPAGQPGVEPGRADRLAKFRDRLGLGSREWFNGGDHRMA